MVESRREVRVEPVFGRQLDPRRRRLGRLLLGLFFAFTFSAAFAQDEPSAAGTWEGFVELPGNMLGVSVTLNLDAAGWSGVIDIPAQGSYGLPLTDVSVSGTDVSFAIADTAGEPTFTGTLDADTIQGTLSQFGQQFRFLLHRSDGTSLTAPTLFEDSTGRYSVRVPAEWAVYEQDGVATVMSPEGGVLVHLMVGPAADPAVAVSEAWFLVDGGPVEEPVQVLEPPSAPGVDRTLLYNYGSPTSAFLYQALVQAVGDKLYLMLIEGNMNEAQRFGAQLQIVITSFTITGRD